MTALAVMALVILLVVAAFCINVSYMQLTRSELQAATDAAARAGTIALASGLTARETRDLVQQVAQQNLVANLGLEIRDADIVLGAAVPGGDGKFQFQPGGSPPNALRVIGNRSASSASGGVGLFFGKILGAGTFEPQLAASAAEREREICIVLPKPPNPSLQPAATPAAAKPRSARDEHFSSDNLRPFLQFFVDALQVTPAPEQVALVPYGETASTSLQLTTKLSELQTAAGKIASEDGCAIGLGLRAGIRTVTDDSQARNHAQRLILLFVDDFSSGGPAPESLISTALQHNVVVHVIALAGFTETEHLTNLATATGGRFFSVSDFKQLQQSLVAIAFRPAIIMFE